MLNLFGRSPLQGGLKPPITVENIMQIPAVIARIVFDHARRFDDRHDLGVHLGAVKAIPWNIFKRPSTHLRHRQIVCTNPCVTIL
jgi:hypothetical protein